MARAARPTESSNDFRGLTAKTIPTAGASTFGAATMPASPLGSLAACTTSTTRSTSVPSPEVTAGARYLAALGPSAPHVY
jgi:hypothetical protein